MRLLRYSIMAGALLAFASCGGGTTPTRAPATAGAPTPAATAAPTPAATAAAACTGSPGVQVAIQDFSFAPQQITATVGGSVTWTNAGQTAHTVTFTGGPDCGRVAPAGTVTQTFDTAGTFPYICTIHPSMTGSVVVQ